MLTDKQIDDLWVGEKYLTTPQKLARRELARKVESAVLTQLAQDSVNELTVAYMNGHAAGVKQARGDK